MTQSNTPPVALPTRQIVRQLIQTRITEAVEQVIEEELSEQLGVEPYVHGDRVSPGVYFYRVRAESEEVVGRLVLLGDR